MKREIRMPSNGHFAAAPAEPAEEKWRKYVTLSPKVGSSLVAGALTTIFVAECTRRGVTIPGDEATAITTLLMFLAGYFMPHLDDTRQGQAHIVSHRNTVTGTHKGSRGGWGKAMVSSDSGAISEPTKRQHIGN